MTNKPIEEDIADLDSLSVPELKRRFSDLFGWNSPISHRSFLTRRIAWKMQEARFGGLSEEASARLEALIDEIELPLTSDDDVTRDGGWRRNIPQPGTVLTRDYKGRQLRVTVLRDGFEFEGETHRSLAAVAKAATGGSAWNGRHFFGLTPRSEKAT